MAPEAKLRTGRMTKSLRYRGAWREKIVHAKLDADYCRKLENPEEKTGNVRMGALWAHSVL